MAFIAVELKVVEGLAAAVARAAGVTEDRVGWGLVRLWHRTWADEAEVFSRTALAGVFGPEHLDAILGALESFEFLEAAGSEWRVRGADRYLRLKESRRRGAAATNAKKKSAKAAREAATLGDAQGTQKDTLERPAASAGRALNDALPPNTEHRTPNTEEQQQPVVVVDEFWAALCGTRSNHDIAPEAARPRGLSKWVDARVAEGTGLQPLVAAYALFLKDDSFADTDWPTSVFLSEQVYRPRLRRGRTASGHL